MLEMVIEQRRKEALDYQEYLRQIVELAKQVTNPEVAGAYPKTINTPGKRSLFDNLGRDEGLALAVDEAVRASRQDGWRSNQFKIKKVRNAIKAAIHDPASEVRGPSKLSAAESVAEPPPGYMIDSGTAAQQLLELVKNQHEY